jgi:N-hydroxyarylamine O-acetyltransferase
MKLASAQQTTRLAGSEKREEFRVDLSAYLKRINYSGPLTPTADTLRQLHLAHLHSVPFENLSIHSGEPIVLDDNALFEKIVTRQRGGFCYELNGLFAALLRELGFNVTMLSAEVSNATGELGPEFDHMALLVALSDRWLADVGFGDSFRQPLLLDDKTEQLQDGDAYRIDAAGDHLVLMRRVATGEWKTQYRFSLQPHVYADYAEMCRYHQTSPESHFTQRRICSRATVDGRVTLSDTRLITTKGLEKQERELADRDEYAKVLRDQFGIVGEALHATLQKK